MGLTYSDLNISIERNEWFRNRVRVSISYYTNYLLASDPATPDGAAAIAIATRLAQAPDQVLNTVMFTIAGDVDIVAAGPAITDAALQPIVEKTIQKFYPAPPPVFSAAAARLAAAKLATPSADLPTM
jgi:hypothetical protein